MRNIDKLKEILKEKATKIRDNRAKLKMPETKYKDIIQSDLHYMKIDYRHHHISYCELRGKTRDQIEKPKSGNKPDEYMIEKIKLKYAWTPEEIKAYEERKAEAA